MSGSAFANFAFCEPNNHVESFKQIFGLDEQATGQNVLEFMLNVPVEQILRKTPVISLNRSMVNLFFGAVVESSYDGHLLLNSLIDVLIISRFYV